jgi:vesicle-associated membrane protein 7
VLYILRVPQSTQLFECIFEFLRNFGFLINIQKEFAIHYTPHKIEKANAYGFDKSFRKKLANLMHHCNTNRSFGLDSRTSQLNAEVQSIKKTLDLNIDLLIRRGMRMEDLVEQSEDLLVESQVFNKRSTKLKRAMKKKSRYYKLILATFALLIVYLMMVKLCGFDLSCKADASNNNNYYSNRRTYYGGNYADDGQRL